VTRLVSNLPRKSVSRGGAADKEYDCIADERLAKFTYMKATLQDVGAPMYPLNATL
jgi:hypothetical protein